VKPLAAEAPIRVAKSFISAVAVVVGGAVTMAIRERNALDARLGSCNVSQGLSDCD